MSDVVALADEYWQYHRSTAQLWNIDRGDVDEIEHWEDLSPGGVAARLDSLSGFIDRARALDAHDDRERTLLAALSFSADAVGSLLPFDRDVSLVAGPFNFNAFLSVLVPGYPLATAAQGVGYVTKIRAMPAFIEQWIDGLRDGAAVGRTATARGIGQAVAAYDTLLTSAPAHDPLAAQEAPIELSAPEAERWRTEVLAAIAETRPSIALLRDVLHDEILPAARSDDRPGVCHMPGGDQAYPALLRASTSTDLSPDAIHQLGLEQLARLDDEYRLLEATLGIDHPATIRERLRSDASLRYDSPDEVIADAMAALARAAAEAPNWFDPLPLASCSATAVGSGSMAFYTAPSPDGARGGTCFFNTSVPQAWTRFQLEVTTFHESVPGHHLQLALAQELDLHPILGELEVTSYGEGWGLYAERLADDMSLYSSPLHRLGMVTLDSLRAARLVVDTGLHSRGWSRAQAIQFLTDHTAQDRHSAETEIDRYIAQPGQATSYMIGRLEIDRLCTHARSSLGASFDIRDFHRVVLGNGMTPLDELARGVDRWIQQRRFVAGSADTHTPSAQTP